MLYIFKSSVVGISRDGSLAQTRPEIAAQWHPSMNENITPNDITEKSTYKAWWLGNDGGAWQAIFSARCRKNGGTKRSKSLVIKCVNDLQTLRPDLAKEWNYEKNGEVEITSVMPGSKNKIWWICYKAHEWQATVTSRNVSYESALKMCDYMKKPIGSDKPLSSKTVLHHHRLISSMLSSAVEWGILFSNPCDRTKAQRVEKDLNNLYCTTPRGSELTNIYPRIIIRVFFQFGNSQFYRAVAASASRINRFNPLQ